MDKDKDLILFEDIAKDLLKYFELEIDICHSEEEAKRKSELITAESKSFPVYFFESDTSGEKKYEEFFADFEELNLNEYINLGIIKNSCKRNINEMELILKDLENIFLKKGIVKEDIVGLLKKNISNFKHIETGKNLDSKM